MTDGPDVRVPDCVTELSSAVHQSIELSRRMTEDAIARGGRWSGSRSVLQALARARGGACDPAGVINGDLDD